MNNDTMKDEFNKDDFILGEIFSNIRWTKFIENKKKRELAKKKLEEEYNSMYEYMVKKYGDLDKARKKYS